MDENRDAKGRFVPGCTPGPGRAPRATEAAILAALREEFTPERVVETLRTALEIAEKQGSVRGMMVVMSEVLPYVLGKPAQQVSISQSDSNELLARLLSDRTPLLPPRVGEMLTGPSHLLEDDPPEL